MKRNILLTAFVTISTLALGCGQSGQPPEDQSKSIESSTVDKKAKPLTVDVSTPANKTETISSEEVSNGKQVEKTVKSGCAKCMFKMKGIDSCELAVMIDDKPYLVTGAFLDPPESGLCKSIKKAKVTGRLVKYDKGLSIDGQQGEFIAESINIIE